MNIVPIAFAFDNNLSFPACICLSSLLVHAKNDTFYDIFILHSKHEQLNHEELDKLPFYYPNCRIRYRTVGDIFDKAYEIRGITTPAYYRLLIPELIPEYGKVIYSDVDIIFRMDLAELYFQDLEGYYIAATHDLGLNLSKDGNKYINSLPKVHVGEYIQSGFIVLNNEAILEDNKTEEFKHLSRRNLKYQDQDILNIACNGKIKYLSLKYNMTDYSFYYANRKREKIETLYSNSKINEAITSGNIHYNGHKPWKKYAVNFDIWWEYYRKSPFFDEKHYFDFFYNKLNELDQLPLWKRIKILIRFFLIRNHDSEN